MSKTVEIQAVTWKRKQHQDGPTLYRWDLRTMRYQYDQVSILFSQHSAQIYFCHTANDLQCYRVEPVSLPSDPAMMEYRNSVETVRFDRLDKFDALVVRYGPQGSYFEDHIQVQFQSTLKSQLFFPSTWTGNSISNGYFSDNLDWIGFGSWKVYIDSSGLGSSITLPDIDNGLYIYQTSFQFEKNGCGMFKFYVPLYAYFLPTRTRVTRVCRTCRTAHHPSNRFRNK